MMNSARLFFFISLISLSGAAAAEVSVQISPGSFPVTEGAQLSLTITDGKVSSRPEPPVPEGISIRPYGQSTNMQITNGHVSRSLSLTYIVTSDREGEFTIPSFPIPVGSETLETEPVTFSVISAAGVPSLPQGNSSGTQNSSSSAATQPGEAFGFVRLEIPKRERSHLYVGEMAPARIKAYFPMDAKVSLTSAPRPEGQGFTLHNVSDEPEQAVETINGQQYRALTWYAGISTAKAGEYPITVSLNANVAVRQQGQNAQHSRPRSMLGGNSPFNDPFFDQFFKGSGFDSFFAPMVQREVTLTSPGNPVEIRSLPDEGKPENFSGAVGQFTLGGFKLPAEAKTGEPQQIHVTVDGKGNFDRVDSPSLNPSENWKTYSPKTTFTPKDVASFAGSKSFDFSAVPQKGGKQNVTLSFSYFDPEAERYNKLSSPEIKIDIEGSDVVSMSEATTPINDREGESENRPLNETVELAPLRNTPTNVRSLKPLILRPIFYGIGGVSGTGILFGLAFGVWRRRHLDPERVANRAVKNQTSRALAAAEAAAQKGDAVGFFESARTALQSQISAAWGRPASCVTLAELRRRLPSDSPALAIFSQADTFTYAPAADFPQSELQRWRDVLGQVIENERLFS